jgi:hypothetical protein
MAVRWSIPWILTAMGVAAACGDETAEPITFSELRIEEIGASRAVVRFTTSIPTACEAEYGRSGEPLDGRARDPDMAPGETAIDHEVAIEDLLAATSYEVRAHATDADGRSAYSDPVPFATVVGGEDPTAGLRNVALLAAGATIEEVSSNFGGGANDAIFGIDEAFDDQMATEWSSNRDGDDAYVVLALAAPERLTHVGFRSRQMMNGTAIIHSFELTIDAVTYGPFDAPDPTQRYVFTLAPPAVASVVRFDAVTTTGGHAGAKEIQLYAE